jgi:hypothetical protein
VNKQNVPQHFRIQDAGRAKEANLGIPRFPLEEAIFYAFLQVCHRDLWKSLGCLAVITAIREQRNRHPSDFKAVTVLEDVWDEAGIGKHRYEFLGAASFSEQSRQLIKASEPNDLQSVITRMPDSFGEPATLHRLGMHEKDGWPLAFRLPP